MRFFMGKQGGMVSVFLVMILVPLMAFSAVCVEALHYQSTSGIYEEAVDLSENAVLSGYDKKIFEEYGLLGIKEDGSEQETFLSYLHENVGGSEEVGTNLTMNVADSDIKKFELSDPSIMKKQIIRYTDAKKNQTEQDPGKELIDANNLRNRLKNADTILQTRIREMSDCVTLLENMMIYQKSYDLVGVLGKEGDLTYNQFVFWDGEEPDRSILFLWTGCERVQKVSAAWKRKKPLIFPECQRSRKVCFENRWMKRKSS